VCANSSWRARITRIRLLWNNRFRFNDQNVQAMERLRSHLTPENKNRLERFDIARWQRNMRCLMARYQKGLSRQTALGNCGLVVAALCNKI